MGHSLAVDRMAAVARHGRRRQSADAARIGICGNAEGYVIRSPGAAIKPSPSDERAIMWSIIGGEDRGSSHGLIAFRSEDDASNNIRAVT